MLFERIFLLFERIYFLWKFWLVCYRKVPNPGLLPNYPLTLCATEHWNFICKLSKTIFSRYFLTINFFILFFPQGYLHFEMCLYLQLLAVCSFFTISLHAKLPLFNFDGMDSNSASKERLPSSCFQTDHDHWHCFVAEAEREKRIREGGDKSCWQEYFLNKKLSNAQ